MFVGHACLPNGFSRVIHSILRELPDGYNLHHFAINLARAEVDGTDLGWTPHYNRRALHSPDTLSEVVERVRPQIVVVVDEPWVCARLAPVLLGERSFHSIFYGAVDSEAAISQELANYLAGLDCFVAFTEFGRNAVSRSFGRLRTTSRLPRLEAIPHGVDRQIFRPLTGGPEDDFRSSRQRARELLFADQPASQDAFIVLNANRNQPFKRIDIFLDGFALFARGKPSNVKLYLHMGSRPREPGVTPLVDRLGIRERTLCTTTGDPHPTISSIDLNLIYAACDVGVNTSEKEGWGLISFEHAATGGAQIVPRHSACAELWSTATALMLEPVSEGNRQTRQLAGQTVTADSVAQALEALYRQPDLRREIARSGYANAAKDEYSWHNIAGRWDDVFKQLLSGV